MVVSFLTSTVLSELDITTIGGSSKRGDDTKIGQFCSGLKYALAILLREGVKVNIYTNSNTEDGTSKFKFYSFETDNVTDTEGKSKEVLVVNKGDYFVEGNLTGNEAKVVTAFSSDLGFDWKPEFAIRELWSNMVDEGGRYEQTEDFNLLNGEPFISVNKAKFDLHPFIKENGTVITLEFDENNKFFDIWNNRDNYFLGTEEIVSFSRYNRKVGIHKSVNGHFQIFKQGILVYEYTEMKSDYVYNINFGQLDERRILSDVYSIKNSIACMISEDAKTPEQINFLLSLVKKDECFTYDSLWLGRLPQELISEVVSRKGQITTYNFIEHALKKLPGGVMAEQIFESYSSAVIDFRQDITVKESASLIQTKEVSKADKHAVYTIYSFPEEFDIKESIIKGTNCVADKFNNCILVNSDFDINIEQDMLQFVMAYGELLNGGKGNPVTNLMKLLLTKIKKNS